MPKLLFVGAGNIAQSIMKGIIKAQPSAAERIMATAPTTKNLNIVKNTLGCRISLLNNVIRTLPEFNPELVFICVKPQVLMESISKRDQLTDLLKSLPHRCATLSLLAGIKSQILTSAFNLPERNMVRVMLNTAAEINSTSVVYHTHQQIQPEMLTMIEDLLRLIGKPVVRLNDESLMDVATGVCGSGIAFFYEAIQAISDIGVKNGLNRTDATKIAAQLSKSAGEMLLTRSSHPYELRDEVSSPAGTTIYGLHKWHEQCTSQKIAQAVQSSIDRSKQLSAMSEAKLEDLINGGCRDVD